MKKNLIFKIILVVFFIVIGVGFAYSICTPENIPKIDTPGYYELNEEEPFFHAINLSNSMKEVSFSWVPVNITMEGFSISRDGKINFTPKRNDSGSHTLFVIATTPQGCYDLKKLNFQVYNKPLVLEYLPLEQTIEINETDFIRFFLNATTNTQDGVIVYEWYKNNRLAKSLDQHYLFITNYTSSGKHIFHGVAKDSRNLNRTVEWTIIVKDRNRPPFIKSPLPNLIIADYAEGKLLNLYDYIGDHDGDMIEFQFLFSDEGKPEIIRNESRVFKIFSDETGNMYVGIKSYTYLRELVRVKALDQGGMSVTSEPFLMRLATEKDKFEIIINRSVAGCIIDIKCGDWSECLPTGIRIRECADINNCNKDNKVLTESEQCDYNATCFDGIRNQDEEGVDCGGPCPPCPTCNDGIQNQNETDIDCGGPCPPCPTCNDGIQNQNETDIDCGGPCHLCEPGRRCLRHTDCISLICQNNTCTTQSCSDDRQNQGEAGVDCGGPCEPCPTCNDGIQNQGEEGLDCGGPCKPCETCFDGIRNNGEWLTDCGGPCSTCTFFLVLLRVRKYLLIIIPIIVAIMIYFIIWKMYNRDRVLFMNDLARIFRFLPKRLPVDSSRIIIRSINRINAVKIELFNLDDKKKIAEDYTEALHDLFKELFEIEGSFSYGILNSSVRSKIFNPFLANIFLILYDYANISPTSPLFKIELNEKIDEIIRILNMIRELI